MRYEILGPVRVTEGTSASTITARKVEVLLAALLIQSGQVVSVERISAEIWDGDPPRRAVAALYVYISQLRKFLLRTGRCESPIVTWAPNGYLLQLGQDELDFHDLQNLVQAGRIHLRVGRYEDAVDAFHRANALWRGPALGGVRGGPILSGFVAWCEEERLECVEMEIEANLMLGRHREMVSKLYSLVNEHPLREAFYRQLMLALYRSERRADALKIYQSARSILREELGLEPDRSLREMQRAILSSDAGLDTIRAR